MFFILVTLFAINKQFLMENNLDKYRKTVQTQKYMMHALGGANGKNSYINSVEVLRELYMSGYRLYEVDINLTSDDKAVLVHGWSKADYEKRIGIVNYDINAIDSKGKYIPTFNNFMNFQIQGKYAASSFQELVDFMKSAKDMFVMIDIGRRTYDETKHIYEVLVSATADDQILKRFIVGGHTKDMISAVRDTYDFELYNLYLASEDKREADWLEIKGFINYCHENGISSFSVSSKVYDKEIAGLMDESDLICYVFTVNSISEEEKFRKLGVEIVGTDFLR